MGGFLNDPVTQPEVNYLGGYQSDQLVEGDMNSPPAISSTPESSAGSIWSQMRLILGTLGETAREVGRTVGQVEETVKGADEAYRAGRATGQAEARAKNWWDRRTEMEKFGIVIGIAGLGIAIYSVVRSK